MHILVTNTLPGFFGVMAENISRLWAALRWMKILSDKIVFLTSCINVPISLTVVVTQETDDLAAAADDDDNTTTTETTTQESIIRKTTTTSTTYTTNVENLQQFDNKREEESVVIQEIKPEFEREPSPETIEPQIIEPQLVACTFGQEEEPKVEVTREESSNVTTTDDGTQVFTQTRKTTITTTTISEQPQEFEPSYPGKDRQWSLDSYG